MGILLQRGSGLGDTLQLRVSHAFAPTRSNLDVVGPGEKDMVAILVGLEIGVSHCPVVGTHTVKLMKSLKHKSFEE